MAAFSTTAVRLLLAVLVAAGVGGAIFLAVRASNGGDPQVAGKLTQTVTVVATITVPSPTAVEGTPTPEATSPAQPTATPYPALPPPPPKPDNPANLESAVVAGGQWYEFNNCVDFYLPPGWTYVIHAALGDPSGRLTLGIEEQSSGSFLTFAQDTLEIVNRTVLRADVDPVWDQIAETIASKC